MKVAKTASLRNALIMLSLLLPTGMAWGLAQVESRSYGSYERDDQPLASTASAPALELLRKMEFLEQEVQELRGKMEEQNYQIQQLQEHQKKLYLDLDQRLREGSTAKPAHSGITLELPETQTSALPSTTDALPGATDPEHSVEEQALPTSASPQEKALEEKAYQNAYHLIQNKDYDKALVAFKSLVKSFPQGKYVPNAQYWLGEIYLSNGSLELAAVAFDTVYHQYPQHPKAADSLLKLGYVAYAKGEWKRSQTLLAEVKNQFPGSTSAQLADSRLQRMQHEGKI